MSILTNYKILLIAFTILQEDDKKIFAEVI